MRNSREKQEKDEKHNEEKDGNGKTGLCNSLQSIDL